MHSRIGRCARAIKEMHALLFRLHTTTCTFARMQLRRRCAAAEPPADPMQLAKHAKVLTDTFRARKRLVHEVHAVHGKSIATRAVSKETTVVTSAADAGQPAAPERAAIVRRRKAAPGVTAADAAPSKAETATSTEAPPKRRKRTVKAVKSPAKAAAAVGVAEAVLNTITPPAPVLPPLDPEGISAGLTHLASVNERALAKCKTHSNGLTHCNAVFGPSASPHLMVHAAGLAALIAEYGPPQRLVPSSGSTFSALTRSIVSQQLATGAARVIYGRFLLACQVQPTGMSLHSVPLMSGLASAAADLGVDRVCCTRSAKQGRR